MITSLAVKKSRQARDRDSDRIEARIDLSSCHDLHLPLSSLVTRAFGITPTRDSRMKLLGASPLYQRFRMGTAFIR